jgi:hypothetical protein
VRILRIGQYGLAVTWLGAMVGRAAIHSYLVASLERGPPAWQLAQGSMGFGAIAEMAFPAWLLASAMHVAAHVASRQRYSMVRVLDNRIDGAWEFHPFMLGAVLQEIPVESLPRFGASIVERRPDSNYPRLTQGVFASLAGANYLAWWGLAAYAAPHFADPLPWVDIASGVAHLQSQAFLVAWFGTGVLRAVGRGAMPLVRRVRASAARVQGGVR